MGSCAVETDLEVVYGGESLEALSVLQAQYLKLLKPQGRHSRDGRLREIPATYKHMTTDFVR